MTKDLSSGSKRVGKKYLKALGELYGGSGAISAKRSLAPASALRKGVPEKIKIPTESQEQVKFCDWLRLCNMVFYKISNEGKRSWITGMRFKREGMSAGVPDLHIAMPYNGIPGLYIEVKRSKGGKLTAEQIEWGERLIEQGYAWHVAHGAEEAVRYVRAYFDQQVSGDELFNRMVIPRRIKV